MPGTYRILEFEVSVVLLEELAETSRWSNKSLLVTVGHEWHAFFGTSSHYMYVRDMWRIVLRTYPPLVGPNNEKKLPQADCVLYAYPHHFGP